MRLIYEEVEMAIQEGNPPFTALITDELNNIQQKLIIRQLLRKSALSMQRLRH
jgi:hypothetical protein